MEEHKVKCCCKSDDARQCFLLRYPECRRFSDLEGFYEECLDEECECCCHEKTLEEWLDDDY